MQWGRKKSHKIYMNFIQFSITAAAAADAKGKREQVALIDHLKPERQMRFFFSWICKEFYWIVFSFSRDAAVCCVYMREWERGWRISLWSINYLTEHIYSREKGIWQFIHKWISLFFFSLSYFLNFWDEKSIKMLF